MSRYRCYKCESEHGTDNVEAVCILCFRKADANAMGELRYAAKVEAENKKLQALYEMGQSDRERELLAENKKLRADAAKALLVARKALMYSQNFGFWHESTISIIDAALEKLEGPKHG